MRWSPAVTAIGLLCLSVAGCGGGSDGADEQGQEGASGQPSLFATPSSPTATPTPTGPADPLVLRSDFSTDRNAQGWPIDDNGISSGAQKVVRDGAYRVADSNPNVPVSLIPERIGEVTAGQVTVVLDVAELGPGKPNLGLSCMAQPDGANGDLGTGYAIYVDDRGQAYATRYEGQDPDGKQLGGVGRFPRWDRAHPGTITISCDRTDEAMRLSVIDENGVDVLSVTDKDPLAAGLTSILVDVPHDGYVDFRGIGLTLRGTSTSG